MVLLRLPIYSSSFANEVHSIISMTIQIDTDVDATGLTCPMPLLKAKRALNAMEAGQCLRVTATDQGSVRDFQVFAQQSGHALLQSNELDGIYTHIIRKR